MAIALRPRASVKLFELGVRTPGGSIFGRTVRRGCRFSAFSYAKPFHFRRNFRPNRNDKDAGLHMFEFVRSYMNGRFSVIPGKDVTIGKFSVLSNQSDFKQIASHTDFYSKTFSAVCYSINLSFYRCRRYSQLTVVGLTLWYFNVVVYWICIISIDWRLHLMMLLLECY